MRVPSLFHISPRRHLPMGNDSRYSVYVYNKSRWRVSSLYLGFSVLRNASRADMPAVIKLGNAIKRRWGGAYIEGDGLGENGKTIWLQVWVPTSLRWDFKSSSSFLLSIYRAGYDRSSPVQYPVFFSISMDVRQIVKWYNSRHFFSEYFLWILLNIPLTPNSLSVVGFKKPSELNSRRSEKNVRGQHIFTFGSTQTSTMVVSVEKSKFRKWRSRTDRRPIGWWLSGEDQPFLFYHSVFFASSMFFWELWIPSCQIFPYEWRS